MFRVLGACALLLAVAACSGGSDDGGDRGDAGEQPASPAPTALTDVDLATLAVAREPFCEALDVEAVETALDGEVAEAEEYADGERARLVDTPEPLTDVAHENGCTFTADDGAVARAWVFAPPVTAESARQLARDARRADGCGPVRDADRPGAYGEPSAVVVCQRGRAADRTVEVSYRGLFGDAWLSCSLRVPRAESPGRAALVERADAWCLEAATAAS